MVEGESHLDSVNASFLPHKKRAGVIDEYVQTLVSCFEIFGELTYLALGR